MTSIASESASVRSGSLVASGDWRGRAKPDPLAAGWASLALITGEDDATGLACEGVALGFAEIALGGAGLVVEEEEVAGAFLKKPKSVGC